MRKLRRKVKGQAVACGLARDLQSGGAPAALQDNGIIPDRGNLAARRVVANFDTQRAARRGHQDRAWRGFGVIPASGFGLSTAFADYDAALRFPLGGEPAAECAECIAGDVLRGRKKPHECPAFGTRCTPEKPLGAPMVSSEGACAAYFAYARHEL